MASITAIANELFAACETGKGWEGLQDLLCSKRDLRRAG